MIVKYILKLLFLLIHQNQELNLMIIPTNLATLNIVEYFCRKYALLYHKYGLMYKKSSLYKMRL